MKTTQIFMIAMLLASVYTQAAVKPAVKAKASIKVKKPVVKAKVTVPKVKITAKPKAKVAVKGKVGIKVGGKATVKPKVKISVKGKTGAKVTVKKAAPKLNLTGSCPAAKVWGKALEVLPKPVAYKSQQMCKGLKTGCCSEKSLNKFKADWPAWVKAKSAFFWTLSKWPQGLVQILRHQNKSLKCKLPALPKISITKPKAKKSLKVKVTKKSKRILQSASVGVKAKAPKVKAKVSVKVPKVKINLKKTGAKIKAGMKKAGASIKAGFNKMKAGMKKAGASIKAGMKKAGAKFNANMKKLGAHIKAGAAKLKIKVKKMLKITSPSQFMKGTGCSPLFAASWKMLMPFMRMRKAAAHLGLKCFKAVAKARSSAVCATCDNTQYEKFKNGFNVSGPAMAEIPQACAPFLAWVGSAFKVFPVVYTYAMSTTMKAPMTVTGPAVAAIGASWSAAL